MSSRLAAVSFLFTCQFVDAGVDHQLAILGATNPLASAPGTIRGDYAVVSILDHTIERCMLTTLGRRP